MSQLKIFISYCTEDRELMEFVKKKVEEKPPLYPIAVPYEKSNIEYNAEKVMKELKEARIFLPILTTNSISNQWVNQELGFAFAKFKAEEIKPIVESSILANLKGFISSSNDINYRFRDRSDFEIKVIALVDELYQRFKNYGKYYIH